MLATDCAAEFDRVLVGGTEMAAGPDERAGPQRDRYRESDVIGSGKLPCSEPLSRAAPSGARRAR
jgi:hypothetical protein